MQNITIAIKHVYGKETIYPVCDKAKTFTKMLGQNTLTQMDMNHIQSLGFKVCVEAPVYQFQPA